MVRLGAKGAPLTSSPSPSALSRAQGVARYYKLVQLALMASCVGALALHYALRTFFRAHGGLDKVMGDVCKEEGYAASVCALTRSTGLSLAESVAHVAERDELRLARAQVRLLRGFFFASSARRNR